MLHTIELRDFAIIDELELELSPGLNVLSGETGAGKSIVVDALELLSGARADTGMIRSGASSALVQATFMDAAVGSASRRLASGGRHSARIDGELVAVAEITERVGALLGVFAQHAAQQLQSRRAQRHQLDRLLSAADRSLLERHRGAFERSGALRERLDSLQQAQRERSRRRDVLSYQLDEIDAAAPTTGEDERLQAELSSLQHAERIVLGVGRAAALLAGDDNNAALLSADAGRELSNVLRFAPQLTQLSHDLSDALAGLSAVASELELFLADFEVEPERLDAVQARLAVLADLKRKYGDDLAAVLDFRAATAAELVSLGEADAAVPRLQREADELERELTELGEQLSAARRRAGDAMAAEVLPLLRQLGMGKARFEVSLSPAPRRQRHGVDEVAFDFSANPGEGLRPVAEVASGGELSRIMLALHLVTGSDLPTIAFDEVDAGVGGTSAAAVALLLKRLAARHQVLVVTHLAQIAAHADAHFVVTKAEQGGRTVARVRRVSDDERPPELARMLSGQVTAASLQHARELLTSAVAEALSATEPS